MTWRSRAGRRTLLKAGVCAPVVLLASRSPLALVAQEKKDQPGEEDVSTVEDLMREHGVLRRVLLVYEEGLRRLDGATPELPGAIEAAATLIRHFVEDYHEKLEEEQLFPRFERAGRLVTLVNVLRQQHQAGRTLTEAIRRLATAATLGSRGEREHLAEAMRQFIRMYRPHAAREDTVLFPAFKELVGEKRYRVLGEAFEEKEHAVLGEHGFEGAVAKVTSLEKALGIEELAAFTPHPKT